MVNSEIDWELIKDEFNKFWISSPMREDWRTSVERFFSSRSQDSRYFKDLRPRYDVVVQNLEKGREETTLYKVDIYSVSDRMNQFLPDVPLKEKQYFIETLRKAGHYLKTGERYSMFVKLSDGPRATKAADDKVKDVRIQENDQQTLYETAVEELTEAIRFTAEYLGPDKLPAIEGWDWYDALMKYAPDKAKQFKVIDPVQKALPYRVMLIDERKRGQNFEHQYLLINKGGLADILEEMTGLNDKGRQEFLFNLGFHGHAFYLAGPNAIQHHSVAAVVDEMYRIDGKGDIHKKTPAEASEVLKGNGNG